MNNSAGLQTRSQGGWVLLLCRVVLGGVFVYSGFLKLINPMDFGDSLQTFRLFPPGLISLIAIGLPPLEIMLGLMLVFALWTRIASFAIVVLLAVFMLAVIQGIGRGLSMDCGCFGSGVPSVYSGWITLVRDVLMLIPALIIYKYRGLTYRHFKLA